MNQIEAKLLHFNLNLDYQQCGLSKENQTNQLINTIINEVVAKFKDKKYFILDYKDDTISLIAYNLLKQIQNFSSSSLLLYGKNRKELDRFLESKQSEKKQKVKFISPFIYFFYRIFRKKKIALFSCDNPIYKVNKSNICFKENSNYNIMEKFTIEELNITKSFYNIQDIDDDALLLHSSKTCGFDSICRGKLSDSFDWQSFEIQTPKTINIIKLTGDNSQDSDLINEAIDKNEIIMYNIDNEFESYQILSSEFQFFLKNKSNVPTYWNINAYEIVKGLKNKYPEIELNFIGNFTDEERRKWYA